MTPEQLAELKNDVTVRRRLAKLMAHDCFRNTKTLEDIHAADRISDEEMKALMVDVVDHCCDFLMDLCSPHGADIIDDLQHRDKVPEWKDPEPMIFKQFRRTRAVSLSRPTGKV
jgi:hypothetical protein